MTDAAEMLNHRWAALLTEELVRNGADMFCITPGSRSTPLTVAVARNPGARCVVHYDERGAAFFALGYARAAEEPAVLICTSGTAAANYYPAIIEAAQARVPIIVLTADRPPELLDAGANQTIHQPGMFGPYVRWRFDLPCPSAAISPAFVLTTVDQAVRRAMGPDAGPVHLNCPYREPLAPNDAGAGSFADLRASSGPYTRYAPVSRGIDPTTQQHLCALVEEARRPVLAIGQLQRGADRAAVAALASQVRCPIFPDVTSGLHLGFPHESILSHFDLLLSSPEIASELRPDLLLHIGGAMVSKSFQLWLERCPPEHYVRIADHPGRADPGHVVSLHIEADTSQACEAIKPCGLAIKDSDRLALIWLNLISEYRKRCALFLDRYFERQDALTEPAVARCVAATVREGDGLFLGNSMPIRDMQRYAAGHGAAPVVFANRGASGIDGNIATVAGAAHATGRTITAILGDLAVLHDLNSLALLRGVKTPVVFVVINNDGGGIFHFLPVATHTDVFEQYFATPHGLSFEHAAAMFDMAYCQPQTLEEFRHAYAAALARPGATFIEVQTSRNNGVRLRGKIDARALEAVQG